MAYVYVLRSLSNGRLYIGSTERTPVERLREHNSGKTASIRHMLPFVLVYEEFFSDFALARKRERFLKSGNGRRQLKDLLNNG
jgi:putative endonuclease